MRIDALRAGGNGREPLGEPVVAIACGDTHSLAAVRDGRVFGWGSSGGVCGLSLTEYPPVPLGDAADLAGNEYFLPWATEVLRRQAWSPLPFPIPQ